MESNELEKLKQESTQLWVEYGLAIAKAFGFYTKDGKPAMIEAEPLIQKLELNDAKILIKFNSYLKTQIGELENMKYVGED